MASLMGKWVLEKKKNMDEYLASLGVPENIIEMTRNNKEIFELSSDGGDIYTYISTIEDKPNTFVLKPGVLTDYKTHLGQPMKGVIKATGDKIIEEHFYGGEKMVITRDIYGGKLVSTLISPKGVRAKMIYKKIA